MWISSFVVALDEDRQRTAAVLDAMNAISVFQLGDVTDRKLPVVLETTDGATARDWHDWVMNLPGVISIDVAFVSFDPPAEPPGEIDEVVPNRADRAIDASAALLKSAN